MKSSRIYHASEGNNNLFNECNKILDKYINLDVISVKRIGPNRFAKIKQQIIEYGENQIVKNRISELNNEAKKRSTSQIKLIAKFATSIFGAIMLGSTLRLLFNGLGSIALPASFLGGMIMGYIIDELATNTLNDYIFSQFTAATCERINTAMQFKNVKNGNEFLKAYWDTQLEVIHAVEGSIFNRQVQIYAIFAGFLSLIEYVGAFWIVKEAELFGNQDIFIQAILAGLPVIMTWAIALLKSQKFGIPEYASSLIKRYRELNLIPVEKTEEELEDKYSTIAQLDAGIQAVLEKSANAKHLTQSLAELAFDSEYFKTKIQELENKYLYEIDNLKREFDEDIQNLPDNFPEPDLDIADLTDDQIAYENKELANRKEKWIEQETKNIQQSKQNKLKQAEEKYKTKQNQLTNQLSITTQEYEKQYNEARKKFGAP